MSSNESSLNLIADEAKKLRLRVDENDTHESTVTFLGLADTPSSFSGAANRFAVVNSGGTALEFPAGIIFDGNSLDFDSSSEKQIKFSMTAGDIGFYGRDSDDRVGLYDWANTRAVWYYDPGGNLFRIDRNLDAAAGIDVSGGDLTIAQTYKLQILDALGTAHYLEDDQDGTTEGAVIRTSSNPASGGRIFSVQSSGAGDRLIVKHTAAVEAPDGFLTAGGLTVGGTVEPVAGSIYFSDASTMASKGTGNSLRISTSSGYVDVGPQNTSWSHFTTDRSKFYFGAPATFLGGMVLTSSGAQTPTTNYLSFYDNAGTLLGDIGISNASAWLRLNTNATSNVYTPRSIAAAGAISAGTSSFGSIGDIYASQDILAAGGLGAGMSTTSNPSTGCVLFTNQLNSYKVSTNYDVYGLHRHRISSTNARWTGATAHSTDSSRRTLDWSVDFPGVPDAAYAVLCRIAIRDNGMSGGAVQALIYLSETTTMNQGSWADCPPYNDMWDRNMIIIWTNGSGNSYFNTITTGTNSMDIVMSVEGYFI